MVIHRRGVGYRIIQHFSFPVDNRNPPTILKQCLRFQKIRPLRIDGCFQRFGSFSVPSFSKSTEWVYIRKVTDRKVKMTAAATRTSVFRIIFLFILNLRCDNLRRAQSQYICRTPQASAEASVYVHPLSAFHRQNHSPTPGPGFGSASGQCPDFQLNISVIHILFKVNTISSSSANT